MTARVFRSPWVSAALMVIALAISFLVGPQIWYGDALLTVNWIFTASYLAGPPMCAFIAFESGRYLYHRDRESILGTGELRRAVELRLLFTTALYSLLPLLLALLICLLFIATDAPSVWLSALTLAIAGIVSVTAILALGLVLGILLGPLTGPIAALVVSLLFVYSASTNSVNPFFVGGSNNSLTGLTVDPLGAVLQVVIPLVAVVLAVLCFGRAAPVEKLGSFGLLSVLLLSYGVLTWIQPNLYAYKQSAATDFSCIEDTQLGTRVCVTNEHARMGSGLDRAYEHIVRKTNEAGVKGLIYPVYETVQNSDYPEDHVVSYTFTKEQLGSFRDPAEIPVEDVIPEILQPTWCPALMTDTGPHETYWQNLQRATDLLMVIVKAPDTPSAAERKEISANVSEFNTVWPKITSCQGAR